MSDIVAIPGWPDVEEWFGYSPNFHDAEVLSIDLQRDPEISTVRVHAWRTNSDTDEAGYYRLDRHALVTFTIGGIQSVELQGWNHQNVLAKLWIERSEEGYVLHLPETYGVDGKIAAAEISVAIEPTETR